MCKNLFTVSKVGAYQEPRLGLILQCLSAAAAAAAAAVASVMSDSVRPHRRQPTRLPHPWDSPGKNT